jgi:hypothetical protein
MGKFFQFSENVAIFHPNEGQSVAESKEEQMTEYFFPSLVSEIIG